MRPLGSLSSAVYGRLLGSFIAGSFEPLHGAQGEMARGGRLHHIKPTVTFLMHSAVWDRQKTGLIAILEPLPVGYVWLLKALISSQAALIEAEHTDGRRWPASPPSQVFAFFSKKQVDILEFV